MKILYLAHRIPYPPNKGDKIRSFNEIKHLSQNHEVYLCCLTDNAGDLEHSDTLNSYCKTVHIVPINPKVAKLKSVLYFFSHKALSLPYFYSQKLQKMVDSLLATVAFDCIVCFSSPMAEYIFRSQRHATRNPQLATRIMDFVDVDSDKWIQYAKYEQWPLSWVYRAEGKRLAEYEKKIVEQFDHSIFVSQNEVAIFNSYCPQAKNITIIPNGVDYEYFAPSYSSSGTPDHGLSTPDGTFPMLLFTGAMNYYPNVDGVIWFCRQIFPEIRARFPGVTFFIVGSNPHRKVWKLQKDNGIRVTGFVQDIRPYYQAATVCVVPLRLARGVQNKVLEAMAMGKPVVTTSRATQGINVPPDQHLFVSDNARDFAAKVINLLQNERKRAELGQRNREWVKHNYQWSTHMNTLDQLISSLCS